MTSDSDPEDADVDELVGRLHDELAATAELPVAPGASPYLGEATAIARDLAEREAQPAVVRERVVHVAELLEDLAAQGGTGSERADERVATARELADRLRDS